MPARSARSLMSIHFQAHRASTKFLRTTSEVPPRSGIQIFPFCPGHARKIPALLFQRTEKLQSGQLEFPGGLLPLDPGGNRRCLGGHRARRTWGRSWKSQMKHLIGTHEMCSRDTRAGGADIQRFRKFDKFHAPDIDPPDKHRYLKLDSLRATTLLLVQPTPFPYKFGFQGGLWRYPRASTGGSSFVARLRQKNRTLRACFSRNCLLPTARTRVP